MFIKKYLLTSNCLEALLLAVAIRGVVAGSTLEDIEDLIESLEENVCGLVVTQKDPKPLVEDIGSKMDLFSKDVKDFRVKPETLKNLKSFVGEVPNLQKELLPHRTIRDHNITEGWYWHEPTVFPMLERIRTTSRELRQYSKKVNTVIEDSKYLESKVETLLNSTSVIKGLVHQLHNSSYNDRNETLIGRIERTSRNIEEQLISLAPDPLDLKLLGSQIVRYMEKAERSCDRLDLQVASTEKYYVKDIDHATEFDVFVNFTLTYYEKFIQKAQAVGVKIQSLQDSVVPYTEMSAEVAFLK